MNLNLTNLYPATLWSHFNAICSIPRVSKNEEKVRQYVIDFAIKNNLSFYVDDIGNVIVTKTAFKGMENKKGVILQAHLDMVPQKSNTKIHNFDTDSIETIIDGNWVKANGTTLGADNGIGVAAMLAILESKNLQHGPLEALFTIDEETGMTGVYGLKAGLLNGEILMNLDTEEEGELCIGCAGGINCSASLPYKKDSIPSNHTAYKIILTGLNGGHSGCDIHLGRGNSNKILSHFLLKASHLFHLRIANFYGGNMRNAIPRDAYAHSVIPSDKENDFLSFVNQYYKILKNEYRTIEENIEFKAIKTEMPLSLIDILSQDKLLNILNAIPSQPIRMIPDMPNIVESSNNLAIVNTIENRIDILCLIRSAIQSAKENVCDTIQGIYNLAGISAIFEGDYPGWDPKFDSPILGLMKKVYKEKYHVDPKVMIVHAGLECGIIGGIYPKLDMISFGPTIKYPHSPDERVDIASVGKFWDYLIDTLKQIP